jgi:hypothetical protein
MVVRDLKPQHILLNEEEVPFIQHLGVMRSLQGTVESEIAEDGVVCYLGVLQLNSPRFMLHQRYFVE